MAAKQTGFRGTGMDLIRTRSGNAALAAANVAPAPADPAEAGGEKASAVYENVQVLGDLSAEQFNRLMVSITEWVAPSRAAPTATAPRTWPPTSCTRSGSPGGCCR